MDGAAGDSLFFACWEACFGGSLGGFRAAEGAGDSLVLSLGGPNLGGFLFVSAIGDSVAGEVGMVESGRVCLTRLNVTDNIHSVRTQEILFRRNMKGNCGTRTRTSSSRTKTW